MWYRDDNNKGKEIPETMVPKLIIWEMNPIFMQFYAKYVLFEKRGGW